MQMALPLIPLSNIKMDHCSFVLNRFKHAREPEEARRAGTTRFYFWAGVLFPLFASKKPSFGL